jgi:hypothetical protein
MGEENSRGISEDWLTGWEEVGAGESLRRNGQELRSGEERVRIGLFGRLVIRPATNDHE